MKMDHVVGGSTNAIVGNLSLPTSAHHHHQMQHHAAGPMVSGTTGTTPTTPTLQSAQVLGVGTIDCYEDVFKEITKKLYGDEPGGITIADVLDPTLMAGTQPGHLVYDTSDLFRQDVTPASGQLTTNAAGNLAIVAGSNGLPAGTILVQRRVQDEKGRIWTIEGLPQTGDQITFAAVASNDTSSLQVAQAPPQVQVAPPPQPPPPPIVPQATPLPQQQPQAAGTAEERWFESDERLNWTQSKIARYNPTQKVFRCVDCDFVGFLSRVAEHWLGNHADLRVFQCPRCPYTSAWARCVRMHLTRQHGETLADNSLWKENPVLEEVTKYLNTLKTKVEQKGEPVPTEKRYICPSCPYQTDRRDLYNRHENIHRDEKPFQCYICDKQFNRADHVKKHFIRMHREHNYDINKIKRASPVKPGPQLYNGGKKQQRSSQQQQETTPQQTQSRSTPQFLVQTQLDSAIKLEQPEQMTATLTSASNSSDGLTLSSMATPSQSLPHIAYFTTPPPAPVPSQTVPAPAPVQAVSNSSKKEGRSKGHRKKKSAEKMYSCSYCPWQGVDNWCLKRHLNTHIKPFLCALCDYKAARSERLATHVLKVHNKRVCPKCSFLADDPESLSQHIQDSHQNPLIKTGFNCNICQEYFELRADLEAHAILEHQKVIVQCDLCDFRTTDELSMEAHLRDKHNLTPGMGAVAAAAAAAAAAAIGQSVNTQYIQAPPQPTQLQIPDPMAAATVPATDQFGVLNPNLMSNASAAGYSGSPAISSPKVTPAETSTEETEPETLCEKCGIDFVDEPSRKLHEKRHDLVNPEEDEAVKANSSSGGTKRFTRCYTCSTCQYTCSTKKIMMQHQRTHTGFRLVCQAGDCQFTTPFENSLKEHIQNDHGAEPCVRCPHCGLQMPTQTTFSSHWRLHHSTICSLCVNIYRVRYDVKENDIHDVICKAPTTSPTLVDNGPPSANLLLKMESFSSIDFSGINLPEPRLDDDLAGLEIPEGLSSEPLMKRSKLDNSSSSCSTATLYKRESIKFLPRLVEVKVIPMPPKVRRAQVPKRRRKRKRCSNKLPKENSDNSPSTSVSSLHNKTVNKLLRKMQRLESSKRKPFRVSSRHRFCQKGTFPWLYRNPREGFKCFSSLCEDKKCSWRYPRKVGLVLHNLWYHRIPQFACDTCGLQFRHLYQAFLHKISVHEPYSQSQQQNESSSSVIQVNTQYQEHHPQTHHFSQAELVMTGQNPMLS